MAYNRIDRISEEVRRELDKLLREELRAVTRSLRQMGIAREDALRLISEFWEETSCENT